MTKKEQRITLDAMIRKVQKEQVVAVKLAKMPYTSTLRSLRKQLSQLRGK